MFSSVPMKLSYNSPAVLTIVLGAILVTCITQFGNTSFARTYCSVPSKLIFSAPLDYVRMVGHVIGHESWSSLWNNMLFLLLLGPAAEEKWGTKTTWKMIFITAIVTALIHHFFFDGRLMGSTVLVFLFLFLGIISGLKEGQLPLTFIIIIGIVLAQMIPEYLHQETVRYSAPLLGAAVGTWFGFRTNHN